MKTWCWNVLYIITYQYFPEFTSIINEPFIEFFDSGNIKKLLIKERMVGDGFYVNAFSG